MKTNRKILLLAALILAIVCFWIIPKSRGKEKTRYVRVYTERRFTHEDNFSGKPPVAKEDTSKLKSKRVVVQVDSLGDEIRMQDIKPSLYSRSLHFKPVKVAKNLKRKRQVALSQRQQKRQTNQIMSNEQ